MSKKSLHKKMLHESDYTKWLKLRDESLEDGEKLCYCLHTYKCTCADPDEQTFDDAVRTGAIKPDDKENGWETTEIN